MTHGEQDTKLARRLQKRGVYPTYTACLRVVREWIVRTDYAPWQMRRMIDRGDMDVPGVRDVPPVFPEDA